MKTAIQLYTLRREAEADLEGTLKAVKDAGYDGVELAGLYGYGGDEMRTLLDKYGLCAASAHIGLDSAEKDGVLEEYEKTGIKYAIFPTAPDPDENTKDAILARIGENIKKVRAHGFEAGYHNHVFELEKIFSGKRWLDIIFSEFPNIVAELDLCWLSVGGGDPVEYIKKYAGRTELLHIKDFVGRGHFSKSDGTPPAVPLEDGLEFDQRAAGDGVLDLPKIVRAAKEAGTEWLVVELDAPARGTTAAECAARSAEALKKLIY